MAATTRREVPVVASPPPVPGVPSGEGSAVRQKLENSLVFGTVEATFSLAEYFVLVLLCPTLAGLVLSVLDDPPTYPRTLLECTSVREGEPPAEEVFTVIWQWCQAVACVVYNDWVVMALHAVLAAAACGTMVGWLLYRTVRGTQAKTSGALPTWLGLQDMRVSNLAVWLISYQLIATAVLIGIQAVTGSWYMGLSNFFAPDAVAEASHEAAGPRLVGYYNIINLVFFDPIKEEIVFRGCLFYVLYRRSHKAMPCAVVANVLFGLFHLVNLFNGRFTAIYVLLQVVLGLEIGMFYSARFLLLESIWEPIALHVANNIIAMCIPIQDATTFSHPLALLSLAHTVVLYAVLGLMSWRRVATNPIYSHRQKNE